MSTTSLLSRGEHAEALYGLTQRIDYLRERVAVRAAWSGCPAFGVETDDNVARAAEMALWLAQAEHAYRKLGGLQDKYLPACYRTPQIAAVAA